MGTKEWRNIMRHLDPTKIPGVTRVGPFATISPKELKDWLGRGVIVHICDPRGNTHLHNAVREGAEPFVIKFLLERGVDVNARNEWGETALVIAARDGRDALVEILLNNGADPNIRTKAGYSALTMAKDNSHKSVAERLAAHGTKPGR
jgi:ankyrin repeat protein